MPIYLPIAEMAVSLEWLILLGGIAGILSGLFGIGGGFLLTPFLIFIGIPPTIAVGTQSVQMVATSFSGALSYGRKQLLDAKLGAAMLAGGIFGSLFGIAVFKLFRAWGQIDLLITVLYVVVLGAIGASMMTESILSFLKKNGNATGTATLKDWVDARTKNWPLQTHFRVSDIRISYLVPALIGALGGFLMAIMGIGGGFIMVPAMIYLLGMPTLLVAGTSLLQIVFSAIFTAFMHATTTQTIDFILAVVLMSGSIVGSGIGIRAAKYIRGTMARLILATLILSVAIKMGGTLFLPPENPYRIEIGY